MEEKPTTVLLAHFELWYAESARNIEVSSPREIALNAWMAGAADGAVTLSSVISAGIMSALRK
jgi:hypothetical protein